jgi:hypothetical protein
VWPLLTTYLSFYQISHRTGHVPPTRKDGFLHEGVQVLAIIDQTPKLLEYIGVASLKVEAGMSELHDVSVAKSAFTESCNHCISKRSLQAMQAAWGDKISTQLSHGTRSRTQDGEVRELVPKWIVQIPLVWIGKTPN